MNNVEKDIKDYLHLYLGCEILIQQSNYYLVHNYSIVSGAKKTLNGWLFGYLIQRPKKSNLSVKLLLRPLSDMTKEEIRENKYWSVEDLDIPSQRILDAERTRILLQQGFDLFGLIESGLAIDKTKLNPSVKEHGHEAKEFEL